MASLPCWFAVDLDRLPPTITPIHVKRQGEAAVQLASAGPEAAEPHTKAWASEQEEGSGRAKRPFSSRGSSGMQSTSGQHHRNDSHDIPLQLPPKYLFTCTVGKSVLSKARWAMLDIRQICCAFNVIKTLAHASMIILLWRCAWEAEHCREYQAMQDVIRNALLFVNTRCSEASICPWKLLTGLHVLLQILLDRVHGGISTVASACSSWRCSCGAT